MAELLKKEQSLVSNKMLEKSKVYLDVLAENKASKLFEERLKVGEEVLITLEKLEDEAKKLEKMEGSNKIFVKGEDNKLVPQVSFTQEQKSQLDKLPKLKETIAQLDSAFDIFEKEFTEESFKKLKDVLIKCKV